MDLLVGSGLVGYAPRPADPQLANPGNVATCKMLSDTIYTYSIFVGGENSKCLSVLSGGQIDKHGNINSTRMSKEVFLSGSGGANDGINAREVVVVMPQSPSRLVNRVEYVTCPGDRVTALITTMGVFEKSEDSNELMLTGYFPELSGPTPEEKIKKIRENSACDFQVSSKVREVAPVTVEELVMLRMLDPEGHFIKDKHSP